MEQSMTNAAAVATIQHVPQSPEVARLRHTFRAIIFDWDGTAVIDRREDATALAAVAEALLRWQGWLAVVTGTHIGNIDQQFIRLLAPVARRRLLACVNRGSEVYGFDRHGALVRRFLRVATPEEDATLTRIAEAVRDRLVAETGLEIRIVYNRLNRRKIDLIPLPEWTDPPKAQIGALLTAVDERLHHAGLAGGLTEAIALTRRIAREQGVADARITSDVKHIEIGLTDKGDSVEWLRRELLSPRRIDISDVLIAGDEFGPIAGFDGSDGLLCAGMEGAMVVSVGAEPGGVPEGVLALGGGPARFRELLAEQVALRQETAVAEDMRRAARAANRLRAARAVAADAFVLPASPAWHLDTDAYDPALEHEVESRFAISNGFLGVRASLEEQTIASRPRTLVAGLFDTPPPEPGGAPATPALVSGPDWLRLRVLFDGEPLSPETSAPPVGIRTLDLRRGLLIHAWRQHSRAGYEVGLRTLRFASLSDRALGVQVAEISVDRPVALTLEAWVEPTCTGLLPGLSDGTVLVWHTAGGERQLAVVQFADLAVDRRLIEASVAPGGRQRWTWTALPGQPAYFARTVAFTAGSTTADLGTLALAALQQARRTGLPRLLGDHAREWGDRWTAGDVAVEGNEAAQQALRFAVYHLVGAANPDNERVSIGARALTGDGYRGHVFWDTDIFLLPFYIFTWPAAAHALVMYRYHTLPAARVRAAQHGYRGALYAWESADTGTDVTPSSAVLPTGEVVPIRNGTQEQHISADVAYAAWQYWQATGDDAFLLEAGAEIILETARFWASRAVLESDGYYHIRRVIGPDEFHDTIDDNAYTNGMAQWNLERGLEVAQLLAARWPTYRQALENRLSLTAAELTQWQDVAERLANGLTNRLTNSNGVIEQFAGFFGLDAVDLAAYSPRTAPIDMLLGRERMQRSQVIKQADVVMLLALMWDRYEPEVREKNFRYYERRTAHGSSLCPATYALVAARLGDTDLAERYFKQAAAIDLDDTMGNASDGVHIAALGGLWQAAVLGFGGLRLLSDGLGFNPHLPERWRALAFSAQWRGQTVRVEMRREPLTLQATVTRGSSLMLQVGDLRRRLHRGQSWSCRFDEPHGHWTEVSV